MPGLATTTQQDFSMAMCSNIAPHLIPASGVAKLVNFLIDEDGLAYKRGGTQALSDAFSSNGLTFIWDGWLAGGQRTVIADSANFGVLDTDDTCISLGGAGLSAPCGAVELAGILFIDGGYLYGGARTALSTYSTGTVAVTGPDVGLGTPGSTTVTGSGTSWTGNVEPGSLLKIDGDVYAVASVVSDTSIELAVPFAGTTGSGVAYESAPLFEAADVGIRAGVYATIAGRLVVLVGNRAYFSAPLNPSSFADTDYHELSDGVRTLGGRALGDNLLVFTTAGVWVIGGLAYDLVDEFGNLQQPEARELQDLVLWAQQGVASWQERLIVPGTDGVWLVSAGAAQLLTRSVADLYVGYVQAGYSIGRGAVYRSHYLLPVINGGGQVVDLLVCRLDRPSQVRGQQMWPWMVWRGSGAKVTGLAVRVGSSARQPLLLAAEAAAGSRVLQMAEFSHDGGPADQDSAAVIPEVILRDVFAGGTGTSLLKMLELRYELIDPDTDPAEPKVLAYYGTEARPTVALYGSAVYGFDHYTDPQDDEYGFVRLSAQGGASYGDVPVRWRVNKNVRFARMRVKLSGGASRFVLRGMRLFVRPSGRM